MMLQISIIGDGIVELSGGQKQRVGLARAFYGDPNIIILDEPNANLDEIGERMLLQAIVTAKKAGKTLIMISHKPTIINITDKIVVVKGGQLMDYGPTKEIMGKYARSSQQGRAAPNKQNIAAATSQPAQSKANTNSTPEQSKKTPAPQKSNNKSVEPKRPTEQGNSKTSQDNKNTDKTKKENKKGKKDN
jgi:ATP-binding cassette subfamily C exporter for protease/lipase